MRRALFDLLAGFYRKVPRLGFGLGLHNRLQDLLRRATMPRRVELDGFHLDLDPTDAVVSYHIAENRVWEPVQTRLFKEVVKPGMTVFDVGAHIGYYALLASTLTGPQGKVVCFEPEPRNLALLRRNAETNGRRHIVCEPKAVSRSAGKAHLARDEHNKGSHTLHGQGGLEVETVSLDEYARAHQLKPAVIKLDIEGSEWEALQGMTGILERDRPALFFELLPGKLPVPPETVLDFLARYGYRFTLIDERGGASPEADRARVAREFEAGRLVVLLARAAQ